MTATQRLGALVGLALCVGCTTNADPDDAGPSPADAFVPDAFVPEEEDAFVPGEDASRPGEDAAVPDGDASVPDASGRDASVPDAGAAAILETTVAAANTGAMGEVSVTVPIVDQRSFMVVATNETNARLSVLNVIAPDGRTLVRWQDWYDAERGLTKAFFAERTATVINWPVRAEDPALVAGDYVVNLGSYRVDGITSRPDIPIEVTTITSRDHELDRGRVRVVIVWAEGLADDAALVAATDAAVAHWRDVWAGAMMELDVRYVSSTLDPALPYPSAMTGDLFIEASSLAEPGEITVIVGETVDDSATQYGAAGRLPGPIVSSALSAIVVGWLANAGGDGEFSAADIQLYGEVLAHEVGHYLGLFHPVEQSYDFWDALADTEECGNRARCEERLSTNLMFPYSICDGGMCLSTTVITNDQRGVMQRYTGAL